MLSAEVVGLPCQTWIAEFGLHICKVDGDDDCSHLTSDAIEEMGFF